MQGVCAGFLGFQHATVCAVCDALVDGSCSPWEGEGASFPNREEVL